jgi:hypothetical protein
MEILIILVFWGKHNYGSKGERYVTPLNLLLDNGDKK